MLTFSYRNYLLFEQGKTLPSPEMLRRISLALRLIPKSPPAGKLALSWLKTTSGEEAYGFVFEPFISVRTDTPGLSPAHKAMGKLIKKHPITVEQAVFILSTYDNYRAFIVFVNDMGVWACDTFARTAGLKKDEASNILAAFAGAGLAKRLRRDSYKFPGDNITLEFPRAEMLPPGLNDRMRGYQARLIASGALTWRRMSVLRADSADLAAYYPLMSLTVSAASAYVTGEKTKDSALFGIESRVVKLFDF
ncbi:MAG: hypothetical protein A2X31_03940 [Elusimicrobia bacterium GWB2_63_22]|nr:MAG: hypothetical protein A2X31_03940 [Elusimicrobia bacterium GWB2_63_22]